MTSKYLPEISRAAFDMLKGSADKEAYFDLLAQPLHEELYRRQDFNFLDDLSDGQQMLLSYDYIRQQVLQGGFIQLIQNGYIGLLPPMPGWLQVIGAHDMAQVIDDVLKVYVLNRDLLEKSLSVQEFALLYEELKEFEMIDQRFADLHPGTMNSLLQYATNHIEEFAQLV